MNGSDYVPYVPVGGPVPPFVNPIPPGLARLYSVCRQIYPDQPNPLQVNASVKYWLGGPDPLDYISMYSHPGDPSNNVPPHWHYISFGLSDLHGDGRVHEISDASTASGYGFELTFRLKKDSETSPPTWPAAVMQALAKYVFQSENVLCAGDHVSWHCSLDSSDSKIRHMLMTEDPQLGTVNTPFGDVTFIQIVGVSDEELKAAQDWNGPGIIDIMKKEARTGGPWLVTDMIRGESIFQIDYKYQEIVEDGIAKEGSNLSGVSAKCAWKERPFSIKNSSHYRDHNSSESDSEYNDTHPILDRDENYHNHHQSYSCSPPPTNGRISSANSNSRNSNMSVSHDQSTSRMSYASETGALEPGELIVTKYLEKVYLLLNHEAGSLLTLALKGRLKHGRHFTFKSILRDLAITFVTPAVIGSNVSEEQPYALHGPWLQILVPEEMIDIMLKDLQDVDKLTEEELPKTYSWPDRKFYIVLVPEEYPYQDLS